LYFDVIALFICCNSLISWECWKYR